MVNVQGIAGEQLRSIVERIERLEEEKKALADDIKEVYAEAKANGFDTKVLRVVIRLRKQDSAERAEQEALLDLYLHALGMAPEPDEEAEIRRVARSPGVRAAVKRMGTPVPPTEDKKTKGVVAAFVGKNGTRMSIATGGST